MSVIYIVKKTNNVPSWSLSIRQRPNDNSCTRKHDIRYHIYMFHLKAVSNICIVLRF